MSVAVEIIQDVREMSIKPLCQTSTTFRNSSPTFDRIRSLVSCGSQSRGVSPCRSASPSRPARASSLLGDVPPIPPPVPSLRTCNQTVKVTQQRCAEALVPYIHLFEKGQTKNSVHDGLNHCKECSQGTSISSEHLGKFLTLEPIRFLVLDCRCFIAYNLNHIKGALNIKCADKMTRKRLAGGKVNLADLVSGEPEDKLKFQMLEGAGVVIYDDNTIELEAMAANSPLHIVLTALLKQGRKVQVLKGGLTEFSNNFPELCAQNCNNSAPVRDPRAFFSPTSPYNVDSEIEVATATRVLPHIYLGNEKDSQCRDRLRENSISHVLNVTSHLPNKFEEDKSLKYRRLAASDCATQNLRQFFDEAFAFIEEARINGGRVLVHCQAGVSRSATVVIAYILKHSEIAMTSAYKFVKNRRPIIAPNFNFMGQLMEFEKALNRGDVCRDISQKLTLEDAL